jgi:hypothetical protein
MTKQFNYQNVHKLEANQYFFEMAMISSCEPVFDSCDSNHDVEQILRKEGVLTAKNQTDTESCALVVLFSNRKSGEKFVDRLNTYLAKKS